MTEKRNNVIALCIAFITIIISIISIVLMEYSPHNSPHKIRLANDEEIEIALNKLFNEDLELVPSLLFNAELKSSFNEKVGKENKELLEYINRLNMQVTEIYKKYPKEKRDEVFHYCKKMGFESAIPLATCMSELLL